MFAPLAFMRMVPCLLILSDDGFLLFVDQMYRIKDPKRSLEFYSKGLGTTSDIGP